MFFCVLSWSPFANQIRRVTFTHPIWYWSFWFITQDFGVPFVFFWGPFEETVLEGYKLGWTTPPSKQWQMKVYRDLLLKIYQNTSKYNIMSSCWWLASCWAGGQPKLLSFLEMKENISNNHCVSSIHQSWAKPISENLWSNQSFLKGSNLIHIYVWSCHDIHPVSLQKTRARCVGILNQKIPRLPWRWLTMRDKQMEPNGLESFCCWKIVQHDQKKGDVLLRETNG